MRGMPSAGRALLQPLRWLGLLLDSAYRQTTPFAPDELGNVGGNWAAE